MLIRYLPKNFKQESIELIVSANEIIDEYQAQGFTLTLRQLYYQFVARDIFGNSVKNYKRLGSVVNDARLAGLISWAAIEDRTRNLQVRNRFEAPLDAMETITSIYHIDMWENQPRQVEVWIEKEALVGVIEQKCFEYDVPYFACRGYVSQSEQWHASMRAKHQPLTILHLGDHDPSGIDMTRDNQERLRDVFDADVEVKRIALNMDQIEEFNPPPNPAKSTDTRFNDYRKNFGSSSWELDALEPKEISLLLEKEIDSLIDWDIRQEDEQRKENGLEVLLNAQEAIRSDQKS